MISVPYNTAEARVWQFVSSHKLFLRRALDRSIQQRACDRPLTEQTLTDGVILILLERRIRLHIQYVNQSAKGENVILQTEQCENNIDAEEIWHITLEKEMSPEKQAAALKKIVISEEMHRLRERINEIIPCAAERIFQAAANLYGISRKTLCHGSAAFPNTRFVCCPKAITLRDMKSRWESCSVSKGKLNFNSRLIFTTVDCLEYVIFHELCHFFHPNHGKAYYALLQAALPDAVQRRRKLNGK